MSTEPAPAARPAGPPAVDCGFDYATARRQAQETKAHRIKNHDAIQATAAESEARFAAIQAEEKAALEKVMEISGRAKAAERAAQEAREEARMAAKALADG